MDWVFVSGVASTELVRKIIYRILENETSEKTCSEKLSEHTDRLTKASSEVDSALSEMAQVEKERDESVKTSEKGLKALEKWEKELKDKIGFLQNVRFQLPNTSQNSLNRRKSVVQGEATFSSWQASL